jgi:hypothetical protein
MDHLEKGVERHSTHKCKAMARLLVSLAVLANTQFNWCLHEPRCTTNFCHVSFVLLCLLKSSLDYTVYFQAAGIARIGPSAGDGGVRHDITVVRPHDHLIRINNDKFWWNTVN